ncbi:triple tyrosine motif-containing protein [Salmonirosea aquatica]
MKTKHKIILFLRFTVWFALFQPALGQELPLITNYSSTTYRAHNQNWDISQRDDRIMYAANSDGLLEYDGANWRLFPLPNGQIVRSVLCDKDKTGTQRTYVGGFGEFGFWENTPTGKMTYHSLSKGIRFKSIETEEIWHILKAGETIYFQSFSYIYQYDGKRVTEIRAPGNFMYLRNVGNRQLIQLIDKGLYILEGKTFRPLEGTEDLSRTSVSSILPFDQGKILIATAKHGLFLWENGKMRPWNVTIAAELKKSILNKALRLKNGTYAFGTILNGLYLVSAEGDLISHFDSQNGLQNNTILSLFEDARQNLWLGLNKGMDMISLASPLSFYTKTNNPLGTTYAAAVWNNRLYVGSNSGLFVKKWPSGEPFQLVPGLQGQVWDLKVIDGQLICGHSEGTFRITETQIEKISSIPGGWTLLTIEARGEKFLMQGTYTGLHIYQKNNQGLWEYAHRVEKVPPIPIKGIVQDKNGVFWLSHAYKGLYRMRLNDDLKSAKEWSAYESPLELPSEYSVELASWKNRVLIRSGGRFYTPTPQYKLMPDPDFNAGEDDIYKLRMGMAGEWFKIYRDQVFLERTDGESRGFGLSLVRNSETIVPLTDRYYLFCLGNGYALLDRSNLNSQVAEPLVPLIRKVTSLTQSSVSFPTTYPPQIPDQTRSLRISYALPLYGSEILYQYRLKGLTDAWSDWTVQSFADFTNLAVGTYDFQVRNSLNPLVTSYVFEMQPHWYEALWAKILFLLVGISLIIGLILWQEKRLAAHRRKLLAEQEQKLHQQQLAAEKKIIEIRNESLQNEIRNKSQQLSNIAINVVRKNEILEEIRDELQQVKAEMGQQLSNIHYHKLLNSIERNVSGKEDWKLFEDNFNDVHDEFFKRLKKINPSITPSELRLAACLRMNLATKEMAPALGISVRGVEIKRYRLRKKLDLDNDVNLNDFMMNV